MSRRSPSPTRTPPRHFRRAYPPPGSGGGGGGVKASARGGTPRTRGRYSYNPRSSGKVPPPPAEYARRPPPRSGAYKTGSPVPVYSDYDYESPARSTPRRRATRRPVEGSVKSQPRKANPAPPPPSPPPSPPPPEKKKDPRLPAYDSSDKGPEDRYNKVMCTTEWYGKQFRPYDHLVKGAFVIEGVNYSRYEAAKDVPGKLEPFHDAIRQDLISEVGNGVRPEDIALKVIPGQIKTVVLHYDTRVGDPGFKGKTAPPSLIDAEWCIKVDYVIRARDLQRQQNVAMALFTTLSSDTFAGSKTRAVYCKTIDASCSFQAITFSKKQGGGGGGEGDLVSPPRAMPGSGYSCSPVRRPPQPQQLRPPVPAPVLLCPPPPSPPQQQQAQPLLSRTELEDKDRQLEMLANEIARERLALRQIQQHQQLHLAVGGDPMKAHTPPGALHPDASSFPRVRGGGQPPPPLPPYPATPTQTFAAKAGGGGSVRAEARVEVHTGGVTQEF